MVKMISRKFIEEILTKYAGEIKNFSYELACRAARDNQINGHGVFSDVEGIVLYCLIRHFKPKLFFEISPDTGMSTNYIIQAIGKNRTGKVIGFELEEKKPQGSLKPTLQVIKENAVSPQLVDKYYELVIGDATKTCSVEKYGKPDAVLIDSCHDSWFADWYLKKIIPNVKKFSFIQDISYEHRREGSTEAEVVIQYLEKKDLNRILIDKFRGWIELNCDYFPIRNMLTNSILLSGQQTTCTDNDKLADIGNYRRALKNPNLLTDHNFRKNILKSSMPGGISQFAPRYLSQILPFETDKFLQRQIVNSMMGSLIMSRNKKIDFTYCLLSIVKHRKQFVNYNLFVRIFLKLLIYAPLLSIIVIFNWLKLKALKK
jgi:predicted O-methyltransferase YrrM